MEKIKEYKCKHCKTVSGILTLGDIYQGCAHCGSMDGFLERIKGTKKWVNVEKTTETDFLNKFMGKK